MPDADWHTAWVRATGLGKAVLAKVNELEVRHPEIEIIWKTLMPDHLHALSGRTRASRIASRWWLVALGRVAVRLRVGLLLCR